MRTALGILLWVGCGAGSQGAESPSVAPVAAPMEPATSAEQPPAGEQYQRTYRIDDAEVDEATFSALYRTLTVQSDCVGETSEDESGYYAGAAETCTATDEHGASYEYTESTGRLESGAGHWESYSLRRQR